MKCLIPGQLMHIRNVILIVKGEKLVKGNTLIVLFYPMGIPIICVYRHIKGEITEVFLQHMIIKTGLHQVTPSS